MIKPSLNDLSQNKYNRYVLCVASSKCARLITENSKDSETVGKEVLSGEKSVLPPEEKSIISAIHKLHEGKYVILLPEEKPEKEISESDNAETADEEAEEVILDADEADEDISDSDEASDSDEE